MSNISFAPLICGACSPTCPSGLATTTNVGVAAQAVDQSLDAPLTVAAPPFCEPCPGKMPSRFASIRFVVPAAASSTISNRSTRQNGAEPRRDRDSSSARSASSRDMTPRTGRHALHREVSGADGRVGPDGRIARPPGSTKTWPPGHTSALAQLASITVRPLHRIHHLGVSPSTEPATTTTRNPSCPPATPAGTPQESLDCACGLYLGDTTA